MVENTRGPKVHAPDLTLKATLEANAAGMVASGQPWQDDCAGSPTAELLDQASPQKAPEAAVSAPEPVEAPVVPVEREKAEKPAARTKLKKAKK